MRCTQRSDRPAELLPLRTWLGGLPRSAIAAWLASALIAAVFPVTAQSQLPIVCVNPLAPPQQVLACTLNVLGGSVLVRRNNLVLGLDVGLDRQINTLTPGRDASESTNRWPRPSALGGPLAALSGAGEASDGSDLVLRRYSFSTSFEPSQHAGETPVLASIGATPHYVAGGKTRPAQASRAAVEVWVEGYFNRFSDQPGQLDSQGHSGILYVGAEYRLSPSILIGTLVQFDRTEQSFNVLTGRSSDAGWMAGPYATVRLSDNVFLQARAAWGMSESKISLDQTHEDHFDSRRWLVRGTLIGQWASGPWQFRPRASVGYVVEDQQSYLSSLGVGIPSQTVSLGQAKLGPEVAYQYRAADGTVIEPSLLLEGIWSFVQNADSLKLDDFVVADGLRGKAEAGVTILGLSGWSLGASFIYDGIGSTSYQAIGGKVRGRLPFN